MARHDYDLIIIGGGIAGFSAAGMAAGLGKKVLLVEKGRLGGNCSLRTCIPTKALIRAGEAYGNLGAASEFGLECQLPAIDTTRVNKYVRRVIEEVGAIDNPESFKQMGIDIEFGSPSFVDRHRIKLGSRVISGNKFIIATGSSPARLNVAGAAETPYFTTENIFSEDKLPASIIILGGGPAGIEYATAYCALGLKVTVVELADTILAREDKEMTRLVAERLRQNGVTLLTGWQTVRLFRTGEEVSAEIKSASGETMVLTAEALLMTIGRVPNLEGLSLEKAGVAVTPRGIKTDLGMRTTADNIYAAGDVVGPFQTGAVAEYQALIATNNALIPVVKKQADYRTILWITYTSPPLAHVGLTEEEARKRYGDKVKIYHYEYSRMRRARVDRQDFGVAKFITDAAGKPLGIHILGLHAEEMAHEAELLRVYRKPLHTLHFVNHAYPTYSEAIFKRMGDISYLDRMAANPIIRLGLELVPGFVNNLEKLKNKL